MRSCPAKTNRGSETVVATGKRILKKRGGVIGAITVDEGTEQEEQWGVLDHSMEHPW